MTPARRVALKVDCDTYLGTKRGLPNLLRVFDRLGVRASFFLTLGPDNSGRAIFRVFRQKGFLKKMLRVRAVSLYGPRTILSGTLLPGPRIGRRLAEEIKSVATAGHEVGVHGWDHVRWHDRLGEMNQREIEEQYFRAHEAFENIFHRKARCSAAPGWHSTPASLAIQETYDLLYSSNTRLGPPHFPAASKTRYKTLEIPTTLPTWDETLGSPDFQDRNRLLDYYLKSVKNTEIHTIHTEIEGTAFFPLFERQLQMWKSEGVEFLTLEDYAREQLEARSQIPFRTLTRVALPHRTGLVSSSEPEEHGVSTAPKKNQLV